MQLHYQTYGTGFPLVIMHGLFGMLDNWHTVCRLLAFDFQVFAVDLRNHGRSPHTSEFTIEIMAEDVQNFLVQHSIAPCFLLGHSMGGKVAMQAALKYPKQVAKLVVVDIAPRQYPSLHDSILDAMTSLALNQYSSRQAVDDALSSKIPQPAVRQFLMKNLSRGEDGLFQWKLNLEVIKANYGEVLREVNSEVPFPGPTLVIRSTKSSYVAESDVPDFKRLFPNFKVVDFNTGHWVHAEAPEQLTKTVADFLKN